jgi:GAF domain-containing protein
VAGERRLRILSKLIDDASPELETKRLCEVCAEVTGMSGAGIMLMSGDVPRGSVCTTNAVSALIEQLQYDLGEGPCVDAYKHARPVLEPDLADPADPRWVAFAPPAVDAGVRAIFGFPLHVGAVRLGALNLHRTTAGALTSDEFANALVAADVAAQALLSLQSNAQPGQIAAELAVGADFRYVVHQATGMVAAQLEVSVGQALIRLKAHAFGNGRALTDVAQDVVARRLRFDPSGDGQDTT